MTKNEEMRFIERIRELEDEVRAREADLATFRRELVSANKRLERMISELNGELRVVHEIQKLLVPTEIPNIQGFDFSSKFVPSYKRGGDYFDVFEHEDRSRFGVIVASSSGHVMSACLLSVLLKITGRMEARKGSDPQKMVELIAKELQPSIPPTDRAEIFYGLFDRRQFSLSFAKLGNVLALHFDHSEHELKLLKAQGPSLTAGPMSEFSAQEVSLDAHDKLIFCTQGITEAVNGEGQEFGQDRLYKAILEYATRGVHDLRNQILFRVQEFCEGNEIPRDMTVVVAEVKDRVIKLAKK